MRPGQGCQHRSVAPTSKYKGTWQIGPAPERIAFQSAFPRRTSNRNYVKVLQRIPVNSSPLSRADQRTTFCRPGMSGRTQVGSMSTAASETAPPPPRTGAGSQFPGIISARGHPCSSWNVDTSIANRRPAAHCRQSFRFPGHRVKAPVSLTPYLVSTHRPAAQGWLSSSRTQALLWAA